jgi:hypothetical protein
LRHDFGGLSSGRLQGLVFVDSARVTVNKNVWAAGTNAATVSGGSCVSVIRIRAYAEANTNSAMALSTKLR